MGGGRAICTCKTQCFAVAPPLVTPLADENMQTLIYIDAHATYKQTVHVSTHKWQQHSNSAFLCSVSKKPASKYLQYQFLQCTSNCHLGSSSCAPHLIPASSIQLPVVQICSRKFENQTVALSPNHSFLYSSFLDIFKKYFNICKYKYITNGTVSRETQKLY